MRQVLLVVSCHSSAGQDDQEPVGSSGNYFEAVPVLSVALQRKNSGPNFADGTG